ncbi:hypothetical protein ACHAPI_004594 [Fusarium lateritium]
MGDDSSNNSGTYGIQGLPRPPNATRHAGEIPYVPNLPVRKEISSLANSKNPDERKQWTLFILALERFKRMPVDDKLSYFQIAGIWSKTSGTSRYGIFRAKDVSEAEKDPCRHFTGLHGVNNCSQANERLATVHQNGPDGKSQWGTIENYSKDYTWNPGSLADAVNRMFSKGYNSTWGHFASTKWIAEGEACPETGYISLEYIHNNVHNLTGGSDYAAGMGHMSDVPVAAFDPIFWLHHVQIDRLLAIWQCLYPKLWFDKKQSEISNLANLKTPNVADDSETDPLEPFHRKHNDPEKEVWTSEACRDWTDMNYQYDDLAVLAEEIVRKYGEFDEEEYRNELHAHINSLYPATGHLIQSMMEQQNIPEGLQAGDGDTGSWNDYIINVVYDRYAMEGSSYTFEFFLGGPEDQNSTHFARHNYIGHVYSFGGRLSTSEGSCSNCKKQAEDETLSCAQIPLTIHLLQHIKDNILDHPVEDYLRLHLRWRVVKYGGEVVPEDVFKIKFSKTRISVLRGLGRNLDIESSAISDEGIFGPMDSKPTFSTAYSNYTFLPEVTDGKPGGLQIEETLDENDTASLWSGIALPLKEDPGRRQEIRAHL